MPTKVCDPKSGGCGEEKDELEFYKNPGGVSTKRICAKCDNKRDRNPSARRLAHRRAGQRARAELARIHLGEFRAIKARIFPLVLEEIERLGGPSTRLLPGARMAGETVEDRINGARCEDCLDAHNKGHACEACGRAPDQEVKVIRPLEGDEIEFVLGETVVIKGAEPATTPHTGLDTAGSRH